MKISRINVTCDELKRTQMNHEQKQNSNAKLIFLWQWIGGKTETLALYDDYD